MVISTVTVACFISRHPKLSMIIRSLYHLKGWMSATNSGGIYRFTGLLSSGSK